MPIRELALVYEFWCRQSGQLHQGPDFNGPRAGTRRFLIEAADQFARGDLGSNRSAGPVLYRGPCFCCQRGGELGRKPICTAGGGATPEIELPPRLQET